MKENMDFRELERLSSAFTLSDMEIFIFPELFYPLVLSNIMSDTIWKWRDDPWFDGINNRSFSYKVNRIKQYIMDKFVFNLDLETWGLTTKEKEISRFSPFFDTSFLKQSNALFGYEGDKYYFDIDIRKQFGLDKYAGNVIPYWKTETVEAMNAFGYKSGYTTGAGECVSFSALYAAAMFVIGKISLEDIFLIATPLHSQNFIAVGEGVITNNRRIVKKSMWFNGTELSAKARRALENEKITIVSHISGYIHTVYESATINSSAYEKFKSSLKKFLKADMTAEVLCNFLRHESKFQKCFQYRCMLNGKSMYIELEKIYGYEHTSPNSFTGNSRDALMAEIETDEFKHGLPIESRIIINEFEDLLNQTDGKISFDELEEMFRFGSKNCSSVMNMLEAFKEFVFKEPDFPLGNKKFVEQEYLDIKVSDSREDIMNKIFSKTNTCETAYLAMYVYRDMEKIAWEPFVKAAIERNPVICEGLKKKSISEVYEIVKSLENCSIYPEKRLAQPDEVWNFQRGDGLEKGFLMASFLLNNVQQCDTVSITSTKSGKVHCVSGSEHFVFESTKGFEKSVVITSNNSQFLFDIN